MVNKRYRWMISVREYHYPRASGTSNLSCVCVNGFHDLTKTWAIPEAHVAWRQHPGPRYVVFGDKDRVGVTKPISYVSLFSHFFYNVKILIFYKKNSHSYLTDVIAAWCNVLRLKICCLKLFEDVEKYRYTFCGWPWTVRSWARTRVK